MADSKEIGSWRSSASVTDFNAEFLVPLDSIVNLTQDEMRQTFSG